MRLMIDTMIALMLTGVIAGGLFMHRQRATAVDQLQQVRAALATLHEKAEYHRTMAQLEQTLDMAVEAQDISPQWFQDDLPINTFAPLDCPWLDLAPEGDVSGHPPDPVLVRDDQAGFWYNPNTGVFRARVLPQYSEAATVDLYNRVNAAAVTSLAYDDNPHRQPVSYLSTAIATASDPSAPLAAPQSDGMSVLPGRPSLLSRPPR